MRAWRFVPEPETRIVARMRGSVEELEEEEGVVVEGREVEVEVEAGWEIEGEGECNCMIFFFSNMIFPMTAQYSTVALSDMHTQVRGLCC